MSAKEELIAGLYDLLNREYDQIITSMLQGTTAPISSSGGEKDKCPSLLHHSPNERIPLNSNNIKIPDIKNNIDNDDDDNDNEEEEEEEEDWDLSFADTGDSMNKKFFGETLQIPMLRSTSVKAIEQLNRKNNKYNYHLRSLIYNNPHYYYL